MSYNENEKALIWLTMFDGLTNVKIRKLLSLFDEPKTMLDSIQTNKAKIIEIVGNEIYEKMLKYDKNFLESYIHNLENKKVVCLTYISNEYPEKLKGIEDSPIVLFCKGNISLLKGKSIAIVGTRNPSNNGRMVTEDFAKKLAKRGIVVISGLASGVDKISHEQTLAVKGKTIAVLAGGFDKIYPSINTNLAKEIAENGLLVSEYRPNVRPSTYFFPYRNRIIAGLSDAVLITEAGVKSGALHTKNYALEYGKELFVIPCNINNERGKGTNNVIKTLQGACVTEVDDIFIKMGLGLEIENIKPIQTNLNEKIIISVLEDGELSFEELQEKSNLETKILTSCLTLMQIRGLIRKLPGNFYSLSSV